MKELKTPVLCIRCWRLADYVHLESLKSKAISSLGQYLDSIALLAFNNGYWVETDDGSVCIDRYGAPPPKWLHYLVDAFREVCIDKTTKPLLPTFVAFLWVTRFDLLEVREVMESLNQCHGLNEELRKVMLWRSLHPLRIMPAWLSFGSTSDVLDKIRERGFIDFSECGPEVCSECHSSFPQGEVRFHNPFPVEGNEIGDLTWCRCCVDIFNASRRWPWRSNGARDTWNTIWLDALKW